MPRRRWSPKRGHVARGVETPLSLREKWEDVTRAQEEQDIAIGRLIRAAIEYPAETLAGLESAQQLVERERGHVERLVRMMPPARQDEYLVHHERALTTLERLLNG